MKPAFVADPQLAKVAKAYAQDAARTAAKTGQRLDGSDASVPRVEAILDQLAAERLKMNPSAERIWTMAQVFGSYVGETFRLNHGATWGVITWDGAAFPGMQSQRARNLFWPWGKVQNRIVNGAEDDIRGYYAELVRRG